MIMVSSEIDDLQFNEFLTGCIIYYMVSYKEKSLQKKFIHIIVDNAKNTLLSKTVF